MFTSNNEAAEIALQIAQQNITALQHLAWKSLYELGDKPGESIIICVQFCPELKKLVGGLHPNALRESKELLRQGKNPVPLGAMLSHHFNQFMTHFSHRARLPDDTLAENKVRACILSQRGFIWLQIDPIADPRRLT